MGPSRRMGNFYLVRDDGSDASNNANDNFQILVYCSPLYRSYCNGHTNSNCSSICKSRCSVGSFKMIAFQ
ncbi:MAG: hypothetical protein HeimC3_41770 [Candidatus Heimdallarchaeota archaeon LC_3]|nr:MAG: hypothetical protein HeimC3_41770 [Candidatus Heimdallarchaeota archaeon LC_3]